MPKQSDAKPYQAERESTDQSLIAERAKATHSLTIAKIEAQAKTDEAVLDERSKEDREKASSRAIHDDEREGSSGGPTDPSETARLSEERRRTDSAAEVNRSRMDDVLHDERRSTSELVANVLEVERLATDRNLRQERETTDFVQVASEKLLETEVARHQTTQGILTSREEFLAIVSHDLKNPIGAISGYADLVLEEAPTIDPEMRRYVIAIKRNADLSLRLISDLLDLERISQDKLIIECSKRSAKEIASTVTALLLPLAVEKKIALSAVLPSEDLELECDRDRMLQVLSNLTGNAIKYAPLGGEVRVSVSAQGECVEFAVKDNGPGIPEEKQMAIFRRFAQMDSADRTGLGLGLYIAKTIVESHRGRLIVESEVGKGSTFRCLIPRRAATGH